MLICLSVVQTVGLKAQDRIPLSDKTDLVFASKEKGKELIAENDHFLSRIEMLERQIRLGSPEPVAQEKYVEQLQSGVQDWTEADKKKMTQAVEGLKEAFGKYDLPFPAEIYLTRVSNQVESGAPHCRGANVICPDRLLRGGATRVMAHELFHVLSNQNADLRDKFYEVIHFVKCNEIELPEAIKKRRLTNPDAPNYEHYVELEHGEGKILATPFIQSSTPEYAPGGLFANMDLKLLVLEKEGDEVVVKMKDGKAELLAIPAVPDYMKKIGSNTGYIIHPEETVADNFVLLMLNPDGAKDTWVLDGMKKVLEGK